MTTETPAQKPKMSAVDMETERLLKLFASGGDVEIATVAPQYKPGRKLLPNVKNVRRELGAACAELEKCYKANFKKSKLGMMVKFKPEIFNHDNPAESTHFPVDWEDLYDLLNLRALDASIMRILTL